MSGHTSVKDRFPTPKTSRIEERAGGEYSYGSCRCKRELREIGDPRGAYIYEVPNI
tara:strand:+ start:208 stop:375 length:168 start_codon:yes stop_codon:yes gene_type:complete